MAAPANTPQTGAPTSDGSGTFNPAAGYLNAEARRTLNSPTYQASPDAIDLPKDTVIKRMMLKLIATFDVTYAAGAPTFSHFGAFEKICSSVEVNINGNRIVKSVRPHLARLHNIILGGATPRRATTMAAAAHTVTRASREWLSGLLAYPPTTNFPLINESFELAFENPFGYGGSRHMSELDLRDVASATLKFNWQPLTNLLAEGNAAAVTYANSSVQVIPQIIENKARPRPQDGAVLFDYVETSFTKTYSAQGRGQQIYLQGGDYLMALGIMCVNGDAAFTPQENLLKNITLKVNGTNAIQGPVSHADLQDENLLRFGIVDHLGLSDMNATPANVADAHALKGFALMNLIRNGDWNSAINTSRAAGVDTVLLEVDTPATTGLDPATYTSPLQVIVHQHSIRPYIYQR